jgi:hypothetical protein
MKRVIKGSVVLSSTYLTELPDFSDCEVGGAFYCSDNRLTSLVGAPKSVGWSFCCRDNKLTSLKGAPKSVRGDFTCDGNKLTSLEGAPEKVGGSFDCGQNAVVFTKNDVRAVCQVGAAIYTQGWI